MRYISIRTRITLWFTLMMALIVALAVVLMAVTSGSLVANDAEKQLIRVVQANADDVDYDGGVLDTGLVDFYWGGVYTQIYNTDGTLIAGAGYKDFAGSTEFRNGETRKVTVDGEDFLVYDLYVPNPEGDVWARGIISTQTTSSVFHTLVTLAIVLFPALLVLAAVGGWLIAGQAFRPVRQITDTVDAISDGNDLSSRIGLKPGRDEIHRLAATFDRLLDRLQTSFESEKCFASDASHELRTPTAVILAECEYALDGEKTQEDYRETLEAVQRQAGRMSSLIEELLILTRMDQGTRKVAREEASFSELVNVVCDETALTDRRHTALERDVEPGVFVSADVGLLSRLVQNLLENACKYGRENGHVWVALRKKDGRAVLTVRDDGVGIAPEDLPNIWRRFWRADASRGEQAGTGLGLAIVRQIALLHGGEVSAESRPGEGSTFTFSMPAK